MDIIFTTVEFFISLLKNIGIIPSILFISLEAIIPMIPLSVFITLNINTFGFLLGFIISWSATVFGCYTSYLISKTIVSKFVVKRLTLKNKNVLYNWKNKIENIPFQNLVVIIALPFTPSFFINIAAGIINMNNKKFFLAIILGKMVIVYFWGFVGTSLIKSMTDINTIIIVSVMLIIAYVLSKYISKEVGIK